VEVSSQHKSQQDVRVAMVFVVATVVVLDAAPGLFHGFFVLLCCYCRYHFDL
jgi:hypothetical protein